MVLKDIINLLPNVKIYLNIIIIMHYYQICIPCEIINTVCTKNHETSNKGMDRVNSLALLLTSPVSVNVASLAII